LSREMKLWIFGETASVQYLAGPKRGSVSAIFHAWSPDASADLYLCLGLNQKIMYYIVMLVIAVQVGTSDLGQLAYIGPGNGDFGVGIIAGIGMAVIAMMVDRMMQTISRRQSRI